MPTKKEIDEMIETYNTILKGFKNLKTDFVINCLLTYLAQLTVVLHENKKDALKSIDEYWPQIKQVVNDNWKEKESLKVLINSIN